MPITLNTSHPLYANIVACIGVDSAGSIVDAKGTQTLTPNAAVVVGSGTFGRHFRTAIVSANAVGVAMSPGISTKPITGKAGTTFVVINAGNSRGSRGAVFNALAAVSPAVYTGDVAGISGATTPVVLGTTDLIGTGAHSFASGVSGDGGAGFSYTWVDGVLENSSTGVGSSTDNASAFATYIGGNPTSGGYAGFAADYVWVIHFNRVLTTAEVADLHASIGVNAISLVEAAAATTPVSSDLAATYGVSAYTSASLAASYAISSALTSVSSDLAAAYGVAAYVGSSLAASYSVAGTPASGSFVTDAWINNAGTPRGAIAVSYTWVSLGRIGSLTGKTLTEGTATLSAGSILTATGLPLGAGFMLGAVPGADATTDDVYYEAGTVA